MHSLHQSWWTGVMGYRDCQAGLWLPADWQISNSSLHSIPRLLSWNAHGSLPAFPGNFCINNLWARITYSLSNLKLPKDNQVKVPSDICGGTYFPNREIHFVMSLTGINIIFSHIFCSCRHIHSYSFTLKWTLQVLLKHKHLDLLCSIGHIWHQLPLVIMKVIHDPSHVCYLSSLNT